MSEPENHGGRASSSVNKLKTRSDQITALHEIIQGHELRTQIDLARIKDHHPENSRGTSVYICHVEKKPRTYGIARCQRYEC